MPLPQEIGAMQQGLQQGKMALGGITPSAMNVGGAAPGTLDYAAADFEAARRALSSLANKLHQNRDEQDANRVVKLLTQISDIAFERRKKFAQMQSEQAAGQMSPLAAVGSLKAAGIPKGY